MGGTNSTASRDAGEEAKPSAEHEGRGQECAEDASSVAKTSAPVRSAEVDATAHQEQLAKNGEGCATTPGNSIGQSSASTVSQKATSPETKQVEASASTAAGTDDDAKTPSKKPAALSEVAWNTDAAPFTPSPARANLTPLSIGRVGDVPQSPQQPQPEGEAAAAQPGEINSIPQHAQEGTAEAGLVEAGLRAQEAGSRAPPFAPFGVVPGAAPPGGAGLTVPWQPGYQEWAAASADPEMHQRMIEHQAFLEGWRAAAAQAAAAHVATQWTPPLSPQGVWPHPMSPAAPQPGLHVAPYGSPVPMPAQYPPALPSQTPVPAMKLPHEEGKAWLLNPDARNNDSADVRNGHYQSQAHDKSVEASEQVQGGDSPRSHLLKLCGAWGALSNSKSPVVLTAPASGALQRTELLAFQRAVGPTGPPPELQNLHCGTR
eukprot:TRINITY_DN47827_c0_g1_i1.p1 TRINITY_DN47827_c0_g1~~TRINITY_DN47827_c0_g1_i1.p1  ORF type:complete len:431 (+),score=93.79 TRINITY_DN47827_c0_g1_i1:54-1346(+)